MTFKELRRESGMTQQRFADFFGIPKRTIEDWDRGARECAPYLLDLMKYKLEIEKQPQKQTYIKNLIRKDMKAHGRWEFIKEPNTVDTLGNPVYFARCSECGFMWTDLYSVKNYFDCCPKCGAKLDK